MGWFLRFQREGSWDVSEILPGCPRPMRVFKKFVLFVQPLALYLSFDP